MGPTLRVMGFRRRDDLGNVRTLRGWIGTASGCTLRSGSSDRDPRRAWDGFVYRGCAGTEVAAARAVIPPPRERIPQALRTRRVCHGSVRAVLFCYQFSSRRKLSNLNLWLSPRVIYSFRRAGLSEEVSGLLGSRRRGERSVLPKENRKKTYDSQQRISWLPQRWRTQRNAIPSVNCRIPRIIEFLNAYCARGSRRGHVCLSVNAFLTSPPWPAGSVDLTVRDRRFAVRSRSV